MWSGLALQLQEIEQLLFGEARGTDQPREGPLALEREGASSQGLLSADADAIGDWCLQCGRTIGRSLREQGEARRPIHQHGVLTQGCNNRTKVPLCDECAIGFDGSARSDAELPTGAPGSQDPFPLVRLGAYGGQLRQAILQTKHGHRPELASRIGAALGCQWIRTIDTLRAAGACPQGFAGPLVQPIPMPLLRRWERGVDHARLLAKAFAQSTQLKAVSLLRQEWRPPQVRGQRATRLESAIARGATPAWAWLIQRRWGVPLGSPRPGQAVILVDDVRTTGATLRSAAGVLARMGFGPIGAAVVAVSRDEHQRSAPEDASGASGNPGRSKKNSTRAVLGSDDNSGAGPQFPD
ncbi:MAG: ComF family protein [Phycisphaeraceae bacterium]|nr:ComF family protein [Phycisphaeraceae bacterium]